MKSIWMIMVVGSLLVMASCGTDPVQNENGGSDQNAVECDAVPVCEPGDAEVDACPEDEDCYEESVCGVTIVCVAECTLPDSCDEGFEEVEACESEACEEVTSCEGVLYCEPVEECEAPQCEDGSMEVESCSEGGRCSEVSACGETILCEEDPNQCDGLPVCPTGFEEVDSCDPDEDVCTTEEVCGTEIICREEIACTGAPSCAAGDQEVVSGACPSGATCYVEEVCDATVLCMSEGPQLCDQYGCPDGYSVLDDCDDSEAPCLYAEGCGGELLCGGGAAPSPCDAVAECPAGWGAVDDCADYDVCGLVSVCDDMIECAPQEIIDANDPCQAECPQGYALADDYDSCMAGTVDDVSAADGTICLTDQICGTEFFCRSEVAQGCDVGFELCPADYSLGGCDDESDPNCLFSMGCNDFAYCMM